MKARIYFQCEQGCSNKVEVNIEDIMKAIMENVGDSDRFAGRACRIGTHSFGCDKRFSDKRILIIYEPQGGFKGGL